MADPLDRLRDALAGRYTIERELGAGGMATVYLATDLKHERQVAIKLLRPDLAQALGAERFLNEIRIAAQLRHPHIVGLIDSGEADGLLYYVMPYVEGESLRERLVRDETLAVPDAVRILREVADALSVAHGKGVVHRDIKPENIMVEGRHASVMDFGVAKAVSAAAGQPGVTTAGVSLGTPAYMAPEQAAADPNVDHRADLYALGVLGYELLTGMPPFTGSPQQILAAHVTQAPRHVQEVRPDLSPAVAGVIMRCLEKTPQDRWASAEDLVSRLETLATPQSGTQAIVGVTRRTPPLAVIAGIVSAVAAVVGGWILWSSRGSGAEAGGNSNVIAVMPFTVRGDPDLAYLGEGIVNLLATSLDGAGDIRSVNAHALLGYLGEHQGMEELSEARRVAGHFDAGLLILGDVFEVGGNVRLSASLFEEAGGSNAIANATVEGTTADVVRLVDDLAASLLAQQSIISGVIITEAATATTMSLEALKAYLDAEARYRAGEYGAAIEGFVEATTIDTTFALAFYRLSMAQERLARPVAEIRASSEAAFRHSQRLSDHDRLFLEAVVATRRGQAADAEQRFRELLQAYPDDAEAWYQLGELVFHRDPLLGGSMVDSRGPFTESLRYDRKNIGALYHLMRVVARERDFVALDSLSDQYFALSPSGDRNLELLGLQAYVAKDSAGIARIEADLASAPDANVLLAIWSISVFAEDIDGPRRVAKRVVAQSRPDDVRAVGEIYQAALDLARGRWDDAMDALERSSTYPGSDAPLVIPQMAALPFAPLTDDLVAQARDRLRRWDAETHQPSDQSALQGVVPLTKAYVLGLLSATLGDLDASQARIDELERVTGPDERVRFARDLAQRTRAQVAVQQGRPTQALAILDSLGFEYWYGLTFYSGFYSGPFARFSKAALLRQQGRLEEALAWYDGLSQNSVHDLVFLGPATLAQAEIYEELGNRDQALERYDRFLALWAGADEAFRPMVDSARTRRQALAGR